MQYNELSSSLALSASSVIFPIDSPANHISYVGTASWSVTASHALTSSNSLTASHALTASYLNPLTQSVSILGNMHVTGEITASLLYVQVITSSVSYITGSTIFGSDIDNNTHEITGSTSITGSLTVYGPINGTASWAIQAETASYVATASYISSSNVDGPLGMNSVLSSSYAVTASYAFTASYYQESQSLQDVTTIGNSTSQSIDIWDALNPNTLGNYTLTHGAGVVALGDGSHAEGDFTQAIGNFSHAEGGSTAATGLYSHAEGDQPVAAGTGAHAEGLLSSANADHSHAEGLWTVTAKQGQHTEGQYNIQDSNALWIVGDGLDDPTRHNLLMAFPSSDGILNDGRLQVSGSIQVDSFISASFISASYINFEGTASQAISASYAPANPGTLQDVTTIGNSTTSSVLIGTGSAVRPGIAFGTASLVNGYSSRTVGDYSHAEGFETTAVATYSHTEGAYALATGWASHAEGYGIARGSASHAEGGSVAIGEASHAEGYNTTTIAPWSHTAGAEMYTFASYSFAHGTYGETSSAARTALWVVGDGDATVRRHNLLEAYASSSAGLGKIQVTGSIIATQVPVGFVGTASWAISASYAPSTDNLQDVVTRGGLASGSTILQANDGVFSEVTASVDFGAFTVLTKEDSLGYSNTFTINETGSGAVRATATDGINDQIATFELYPNTHVQTIADNLFGTSGSIIGQANNILNQSQLDITYDVVNIKTASITGSITLAETASYYVEKQTLQDVTTLGAVSTASVVLTGSFTGSLLGVSYTTGSLLGTASYADFVTLLGDGITINGMQLTASVKTVNGIFPVNGNITTALTQTLVGDSGSYVSQSQGAGTASFADGVVWVIAGTTGSSSGSNGQSFIYQSGSVGQWYPLASNDQAANDARYLMLAGTNSPMQGNVNWGGYQINNLATASLSSDAINLGQLTSSLLSYVLTSSFHAWTGSNTSSFAGTASYALTASLALSSTDNWQAVVTRKNTISSSIDISTGAGTNTTSSTSFTHGSGVVVTADNGFAHGQGVKVGAIYAHAEGANTVASGSYSHTEGQQTTAIGAYSHAEGNRTTAIGPGSHAEGEGDAILSLIAFGTGSHAEGWRTTAAGTGAHAEGRETRALHTGAHAEGDNTTAAGYASHTEGFYTTTTGPGPGQGNYGHAEGYQTRVFALAAHTEGYQTTASGSYSHAEGYQTTTTTTGSHAEGLLTTTKGNYSHAEGWGTITTAPYQHVQGMWNQENAAIFIVGDGSSNAARSNLIVANTGSSGNSSFVEVSGSLFIESGSAAMPNYFYFGSANTDGSFRMYLSGSNLAVEKRVAGSWVNSGTFN